jgi:alpha-L-rhamnosidase
MVAFTDCLTGEHGPELNPEVYQFGDWVDPRAPMDAPGDGPTDKLLVAGAYLVHTLDLMTRIAGILGEASDAARFRAAADHYRRLWRSRFMQPDGQATSDTVTAYALAVCFRLLASEDAHLAAGARCAQLCAEAGYRISTGFVGTPLVCDALTATGQLDTAYRLLLEKESPSWLYPVTQGATTIWERWDSLLPDGRVNPSGMTSFNHYALGAVVDWLHRCVGGLAPLTPGYRQVLVQPRPGGGLSSASSRHLSPHGEIEVSWQLSSADRFVCDVVLPAGSSAVVRLPVQGWEEQAVASGRHRFEGLFSAGQSGIGSREGVPW